MDPFSLTVGAPTLVGTISKTLKFLQKAAGAPKAISELYNEITEVGQLLQRVEAHLRVSPEANPAAPHDIMEFGAIMRRAVADLREMKVVLESVCVGGSRASSEMTVESALAT